MESFRVGECENIKFYECWAIIGYIQSQNACSNCKGLLSKIWSRRDGLMIELFWTNRVDLFIAGKNDKNAKHLNTS